MTFRPTLSYPTARHTARALCCGMALAFLAAMPNLAPAQGRDVVVTYGPASDFDGDGGPIGVVGDDSVGYASAERLPGNPLSFRVDFLDKAMKLRKRQVVKMDFAYDKAAQTFAISQVGDRFFLFYAATSAKDKTDQLLARELDMAKAEVKPEVMMVADGAGISKQPGGWAIQSSPDHDLLLVSCDLTADDGSYSERLLVVGADLKERWHRDFRHEMTGELGGALRLSGDGSVLYLIDHVQDAGGARNTLYRFTDGTSAPHQVPVSLDGRTAVSALLKFDQEGNPVIAGTYSAQKIELSAKDPGEPTAAGIYVIPLSLGAQGTTTLPAAYHPVPMDLQKLYLPQRQADKVAAQGEVAYLALADAAQRADGHWYLLAQPDHSTAAMWQQAAGKPARTGTDPQTEDLYVLHLDAQGKVQWWQKLRSNQRMRPSGDLPGGSGAVLLTSDTALYVVLNTNPKNNEAKPDEETETISSPESGKVMAYRIDQAGKVSRQQILDCNTTDKYPLLTGFAHPADAGNAAVGPVRGKGKMQVMRLMVTAP